MSISDLMGVIALGIIVASVIITVVIRANSSVDGRRRVNRYAQRKADEKAKKPDRRPVWLQRVSAGADLGAKYGLPLAAILFIPIVIYFVAMSRNSRDLPAVLFLAAMAGGIVWVVSVIIGAIVAPFFLRTDSDRMKWK